MFAAKPHEAQQELPEGIPEPRNVTRVSASGGNRPANQERPQRRRRRLGPPTSAVTCRAPTLLTGRDVIDHPKGGHDDLVNAAAGALVLATAKLSAIGFCLSGDTGTAPSASWAVSCAVVTVSIGLPIYQLLLASEEAHRTEPPTHRIEPADHRAYALVDALARGPVLAGKPRFRRRMLLRVPKEISSFNGTKILCSS
jgi:hypothetical protein